MSWPNTFQGRTHSEESKRKMAELKVGNQWNLGNQNSKGFKNALGYKHTPEQLERSRQSHLGLMVREANPAWVGGLSNSPYPVEFRETLKEDIRERDHHVCRLCGVPQQELLRKLDVHHIDYDKTNLDWWNLISLCRKCNGKVNANREYWIEYFRNILKQEKEKCVRAPSQE